MLRLAYPPRGTPSISLIPPKALVVVDVAELAHEPMPPRFASRPASNLAFAKAMRPCLAQDLGGGVGILRGGSKIPP